MNNKTKHLQYSVEYVIKGLQQLQASYSFVFHFSDAIDDFSVRCS